jgi:hypothetical protein
MALRNVVGTFQAYELLAGSKPDNESAWKALLPEIIFGLAEATFSNLYNGFSTHHALLGYFEPDDTEADIERLRCLKLKKGGWCGFAIRIFSIVFGSLGSFSQYWLMTSSSTWFLESGSTTMKTFGSLAAIAYLPGNINRTEKLLDFIFTSKDTWLWNKCMLLLISVFTSLIYSYSTGSAVLKWTGHHIEDWDPNTYFLCAIIIGSLFNFAQMGVVVYELLKLLKTDFNKPLEWHTRLIALSIGLFVLVTACAPPAMLGGTNLTRDGFPLSLALAVSLPSLLSVLARTPPLQESLARAGWVQTGRDMPWDRPATLTLKQRNLERALQKWKKIIIIQKLVKR